MIDKTMKNSLITIIEPIFHLIILLSLVVSLHAQNLTQSHIFDGRKTYSINSVIRSTDGTVSHVVSLQEYYSNEQSRAKLQLTGNGEINELYYDANTGDVLNYKNAESLCNLSSKEDIYRSIFPKEWEFFFHLLSDRDPYRKHIIGPSTILLFLICDRSDYFVEDYWPRGGRKIRNIPVAEFLLRIETGSQTDVKLFIRYNAREFDMSSVCQTIPLQITINNVTIDYFRYEDNHERSSIKYEAQLDEFTFPAGQNCFQFLNQKSSINLFDGYDLLATRISFSAISKLLFGQKKEHYIAYDGPTQSLRIDAKNFISKHDLTTTTSVIDISASREYNIFDDEGPCFMTNTAFKSVRKNSAAMNLASFLVNAKSKPTYMGMAKVRGTRALVFEAYGSELPIWLSKPIPIRLNGTELQFLRYTFGGRKKSLREEKFSILIYVAAEDLEEGKSLKLLYLEVIDLNQNKFLLDLHSRILQVEFYNFQLNINDAPNGVKAKDIFSIKNSCEPLEDRSAKVKLLISNTREKEDLPEWLFDWVSRDNSILSALNENFGVPTSIVYDLESKILSRNSRRNMISVDFRVMEHLEQRLYVLEKISNIKITGSVKGVSSVTAFSPNDCLKLLKDLPAMKEEVPIYVYYLDWKTQCLINRDLKYQNMTGGSVDLTQVDVKMFTRSEKDEAGEMFKILLTSDSNIYLSRNFLTENKVQNLHGRIFDLQPFESSVKIEDKSGKSNKVTVQIRRAHLAGINYKARIGDSGRIMQFPKIGLSQSSSTTKSADVESFRECEAACLADLDCHIYSYCVRSSKIECLKSKLRISSNSSHLLLIVDTATSKNNRKFSVDSDVGQELELLRDSRCELRTKIYLDLFKPGWPTIHSLRSHQIIPVKSPEECAEICFNHTLESLKVNQLLPKFDFCHQFKYLANPNEKGMRLIRELNLEKYFKDKEFCFLDSNDTNPIASSSELVDLINQTNFLSDLYMFDYTSLYERMYGFRLLQSADTNLNDIKERLSSMDSTDTDLNYQISMQTTQLDCAEKCFAQNSHLGSYCRSFDYTITRSSYTFHSLCTLNTATLRSLNLSTNLVEYLHSNSSQSIRTWHFEPRFTSFTANSQEIINESETGITSKVTWIIPAILGILTGLSLTIWIANIKTKRDLEMEVKLHEPYLDLDRFP